MTDHEERKIITWKQLADSQNEHFRHELRMFFNDLELAPEPQQHTDEEYDALVKRITQMEEELFIDTKGLIKTGDTFHHCAKEIDRLELRIKEMEELVPLKWQPHCYYQVGEPELSITICKIVNCPLKKTCTAYFEEMVARE